MIRTRLPVTIAFVVVIALLISGCVGPARTTAQYVGKARRTANDAISELQTAALAVRTSERGKMLGLPLRVILSDSETAFGSIHATFDSIQPPDTQRADDIHDSLNEILDDGSNTLTELRILSRRNDQAAMVATAQDIPALVKRLEDFLAGLRQ